jgi:hypothetical protein
VSYQFAGKPGVLLLDEDRPHFPASEDEARAKFAYFRKAEAGINGGPGPIVLRFGASECGSNGGYMRHWRLKEERCAPCKAAHVAVELKRQRKVKAA